MSDRKYSQFEELAYPVLTEAFAESELTREMRGFNDIYSIDWAQAQSRDQSVRVGLIRVSGDLFGILVEPDEMEGTFWIRNSFGDVTKLPLYTEDDDIDLFPIAVSFREKRKLKQVLSGARLVLQAV